MRYFGDHHHWFAVRKFSFEILFHFSLEKFLLYRYPSYYPSYGPTTGSTSFYTTDLLPFSTNRNSADFPKSVRSDPGIPKDIKQEQDIKEQGSFFLFTYSNIFKKY